MESPGVKLIRIERQKQIDKGRTAEADSLKNKVYQLSDAAAILATSMFGSSRKRFAAMPSDWDDMACIKMCRKERKERLIIAGALIAAELDKMDFEEKL